MSACECACCNWQYRSLDEAEQTGKYTLLDIIQAYATIIDPSTQIALSDLPEEATEYLNRIIVDKVWEVDGIAMIGDSVSDARECGIYATPKKVAQMAMDLIEPDVIKNPKKIYEYILTSVQIANCVGIKIPREGDTARPWGDIEHRIPIKWDDTILGDIVFGLLAVLFIIACVAIGFLIGSTFLGAP